MLETSTLSHLSPIPFPFLLAAGRQPMWADRQTPRASHTMALELSTAVSPRPVLAFTYQLLVERPPHSRQESVPEPALVLLVLLLRQ